MKILVVDDEEDIRKVLCRRLPAEGYNCKTAENGFDAFSIILEFKPDVVITDYWMPQMNGIELMKLIHKYFQRTHVIVLAGHAKLEVAIDAVNFGAYAFFRKPLDLDELLTTLGQISEEVNEEFRKFMQRGDWTKEHAELRAAHSALLRATIISDRSN